MSFEEQKNHQPFTGEVVAVGPGQHVSGVFCPTSHLLQPGRRVLFAPMGGTTVDHDGAEHLLMREADILSVLDK